VLVERVEGLAREAEILRAYKEINDFEEQLVEAGIVVVKFWLHISSEEQLRRFEGRARDPWKKHKLTPDDYRNREKRNLYESAANDMVARTSTEFAPWTLVEGEDKRYARLKVLETTCDKLEGALE
jgi:polyphosphate kinase 2 (PPK2 family)